MYKQQRGDFLNKSNNKSVTPSNEQTVWNRGERTAFHVRYLPRLPLGNVGIECSSMRKHYTQRGEFYKNKSNNKSVTPASMNKKCGTEVDVLLVIFVACPVCHLEMSALNAPASLNTTHPPKRRKQWTRNKVKARNDQKMHVPQQQG